MKFPQTGNNNHYRQKVKNDTPAYGLHIFQLQLIVAGVPVFNSLLYKVFTTYRDIYDTNDSELLSIENTTVERKLMSDPV